MFLHESVSTRIPSNLFVTWPTLWCVFSLWWLLDISFFSSSLLLSWLMQRVSFTRVSSYSSLCYFSFSHLLSPLVEANYPVVQLSSGFFSLHFSFLPLSLRPIECHAMNSLPPFPCYAWDVTHGQPVLAASSILFFLSLSLLLLFFPLSFKSSRSLEQKSHQKLPQF